VSVSGREELSSADENPELGAGPSDGQRSGRTKVSTLISGSAAPIGFVIMVVLFSIMRPDTFATMGTVTDTLDEASIPIILACGLTFILACGQFDLSFPGTLGLTAAITAILLSSAGWSAGVVIVTALACGLGIGLVVGVVVAMRPGSTFIVSLSLGSVLTGIELAVSDNKTIYTGIPESFTSLANTRFLNFYGPVWVALGVVVLATVLLHFSRFGRHVAATGSNPDAAYLAGVRVKWVWASCFVIMSLVAALAAVNYTATIASYIPNSFGGYLLTSYAAVFLGSTLAAGRFTILGSVFGVLALTTLQTGLTQLNQPLWTSNVVQGAVLAVAVLAASRGWRAR
jgi:ribose transport system permease protein